MRRWDASICTSTLVVLAVVAILGTPRQAEADVQVFEKDGWSLYTRGLVAVHYQLTMGDNDPPTLHGLILGNKLYPGATVDPRDQKVTLSRFRSGFVGTQLGFGVNRKINDTTRVESLIAISLWDVSSVRGQSYPRPVDVREAWAALVTKGGTFKFGRMFNIYASSHAEVVLLAYRNAIGHPCALDQATIACASVGAGPQYANFDAQFRYISPRVLGFEMQLALVDPLAGPSYGITPLPRADLDINFDMRFGSTTRFRAAVQGGGQEIQRVVNITTMDDPPVMRQELRKKRVLGGAGSAVLDVGPVSVGAGGWMCSGCGPRGFLEIGEAANPVSYDNAGELRLGRGFFGNARLKLGSTSIAGGGGMSGMRSTTADKDPVNSSNSVISQSTEFHVVLNQEIDTVVLTAEFMQWRNRWYFGEKQAVIFAGVGANYYW